MVIHSDVSLNSSGGIRHDTREQHATRARIKLFLNILYPILSLVAVLAIWSIAAAVIDTSFVLPSVAETFDELIATVSRASFWTRLGYTLLRAVIAFAASLVAAALCFMLSVCFDGVRRFLSPIVSVLRALPTMAVALILTVWSGSSGAPVVLGGIVLCPMIYSSLMSTAHAPVELFEITRICGGGRGSMLKYVYIPAVMPSVPTSLSAAAGFGVKLVVAAEILCQTADGIGILMRYNQMYFEIGGLFALTVMAVVASLVVEWTVKLILRLINLMLHFE